MFKRYCKCAEKHVDIILYFSEVGSKARCHSYTYTLPFLQQITDSKLWNRQEYPTIHAKTKREVMVMVCVTTQDTHVLFGVLQFIPDPLLPQTARGRDTDLQ